MKHVFGFITNILAGNPAQLRGIPSRFLYFPTEGHWISKPQNAVLWQRVFFEWLGRTLKPGGVAGQ